MTDYQRLVDSIRSFLASSNQIRTDEVLDWAVQFAQACKQANDRLRVCMDYLQKGLRTEAIAAAEEQPNLLDLVAALDLPDLAEWREACFGYEMPEPPPLAMESAAALNEAYAEIEPLRAALARHRLLALACAPLQDRLATIRELAGNDPSAAFWDEDVRTFERARLEEIRSVISRLHASGGNAVAVQRLCDELDFENWRTAIPADLHRRAHDAAARLRHASAATELRNLLPALDLAYSAMSYAECRSLLDQWETIVGDAQMTIPDDLRERIEPILAWAAEQQVALEQQAVFQEACDRLQQALDVDALDADLERTYLTVVRFPLPTPEDLEGRYKARLAARASARRTKRLLILATIVAAFLLACGIVAAIFFQSTRAREVADVQTALQGAVTDVEARGGDRADSIMKQLLAEHPRVANNPGVIKAASDLRDAIEAERKRTAEFQQHVKAVLAAGVGHPDLKELQLAEPLAKLDAERAQLASVKSQIQAYQTGRQRDRDAKFTAEASRLMDQIEHALRDDLLKSDAAAYHKRLADFESRVEQLRAATGVSAGLQQAQASAAIALLKQKQAAMDAASAEQMILTELCRANSVADHKAALKLYVQRFPGSPRAADFQHALDQAPAAQAIEAWDAMVHAWGGPVEPMSLEETEARIQRISEYLKAWPSSPVAAPLGQYLSFLNIAKQLAGPDGPWKKTFHDLLNNPLIRDLQIVETKDGKRYYTLGAINLLPISINGEVIRQKLDAVTSSDISKRQRIDLPETGLLKNTTPSPSPQAAFAAVALPLVERMGMADWEQVGPRIIGMLNARTDMNVILRAILIQNALQISQPLLDWIDDPNCKQVLDGLGKQGLDNIEWLDPDSPPQASVSQAVEDLLRQLPPMQTLGDRLRAKRQAVLAALPRDLAVHGVILRQVAGPALTRGPEGAGLAYAIGNTGRLLTVAQASAGAWKIDPSATSEVPEGALVFVAATTK
jgi:hypothetical protein